MRRSGVASWCQVALCALSLLAGRAEAQVDPSGRWRTLHTEHFRIHFRPAYRAVAEQEAREAERAYRLLAGELRAPRGVFDFVLGDYVDVANGATTVFPSNRVYLWLPPPVGDPGLERFDSWLRLVTVHELTHVFHLDRVRGAWGVLQRVFGRAPGLFPNAFQPSWVIEGLATYYESKFTNGGRVRGSFHTQLLAADHAGGASRSPTNALLFTRWPDGLAPYAYGSRFFHYLAGAAGDSVVPRFVEATAGQLIPFRVGRQLGRAGPGRELREDWARRSASPGMRLPAAAGEANLPAPPAPGAGGGDVAPAPDGRWGAATRNARGHWALLRWPADSPQAATVLRATMGVISDPVWTGDGGLLFVAEQTGLPQVYRWSGSFGAVQVTREPLGAARAAAPPHAP